MKREEIIDQKNTDTDSGIMVSSAICGFCGGSCPVNLYKKDGKIIKVEGNDTQPFATGSLCVKGAALKQATYHEDRILYPMKRVGERGEGRFERISWEEALDTIAGKMKEIKRVYDAKETMIYVGHPKWFRPYLADFARKYGTPNYASESSTCAYALMLACKTCFGKGALMTRPDVANCNTLLIWGVNPFYSDAVMGVRGIQGAKKRGAKIIVVDPRKTPTTEYADIHLRPIPGTDGALALGMARVLITENLIDEEYIEKYTVGYEAYKKYVMGFTPEYVEEITGVPAAQIIEVARVFGTNGPAGIQMSASPIVHNVNGVQNARAIQLLTALTGNYGRKGGAMSPGPVRPGLHYSFLHDHIERVRPDEDLSHEEFPAWRELIDGEVQVTRIAEYLSGKGEYPIRTLIAFGMNHHMWPGPDKIEKAFDNLELFVNADIYMNDSCRYADLLLPVASSLERDQIEVKGPGVLFYQPKGIEPLGEVKNDMEIILELAKRLEISVGDPEIHSYEEYMEALLIGTGVTLEELKAHPDGMRPKTEPVIRTTEDICAVNTPSGKIEFLSGFMTKHPKTAPEALPIYHDFREQLPLEEYPLILVTGSRKAQLFHSRTYRLSWLAQLESYPLVEIHPNDAKKYEIQDGEMVEVCTPVGKMDFRASICSNCLEGVVNIYHGAGDKDINYLLDVNYIDPISGFPGYKSYCCKLVKKEYVKYE